tara:strand:+ start:642 stop:2915 length:2274 start_codon:yes stop_codon:yes gene_type:complete
MNNLSKLLIYTFFGLYSFEFLFSQSPLSDRYHTYNEIDSILHAWDEQFGASGNLSSPYPNSGTIYKLMEIGTSTLDGMPFWAVKLSFNADIDEDQPRVLILGQCHAEEILGVEISMELIYRFLHPGEFPADFQTLAGILYSSEVWIVPTYNPEGLSVVHGYEENGEWIQDVSYRKNKMDANHNGVFDFDHLNGYGNDIDGVDLNRNYGLNWIFGDEFGETDSGCPSNPSYVSNFDYYRGEAPFSESEVVAIKNLVETYDFLLSIAYHSSRSGCVAERVIYSSLWPGGKVSPDYQVIQPLGQQIAELTLVEFGDGNYHFAASGSMKGNAHDWTYTQAGCVQYLIEVGTEDMQPDVEMIENTIERNLPGAYYLMKRAAGINYPTGPDKYQVTGIVSDITTGMPIEDVDVTIDQMDGGILAPRLTDSFGRYRRLLYLDSFDITFRKHGYYDFQYLDLIPSADIVSEIDISLEPKPEYEVSINIDVPYNHSDDIFLRISNEYFNNEIEIYPGENVISIFEGEYNFTVLSDDILPYTEDMIINSNSDFTISLDWYDYLFVDEFNDLNKWEIVLGDWHSNDGHLKSQYSLTYPDFTPLGPIKINSAEGIYSEIENAVLVLDMKYEIEWDNDTLFVDLVNNQGTSRILSFSNQHWIDKIYYKSVNLDLNSNNIISLGIMSDITISYRGLSMNSLNLLYNPDYDCLTGDLNHDGSILVTDIVTLLNIILDNESASGFQLCSGDYNVDGNLDILDIIGVLHQIIGD